MQAATAYRVGPSPAYDHQMVATACVQSATMARAEAIGPNSPTSTPINSKKSSS